MRHNVEDLRRILKIPGQGDDILLKPKGAQEFSIRGMFDIQFFDRDMSGSKLRTAQPYFIAIKDEIGTLTTSDAVVHGGQTYYVSSIDHDGHGIVRVELREEYEPTRDDNTIVTGAEDYVDSLKRKNK